MKRKKTIAIIDYNVGNLNSLCKALESFKLPIKIVITSSAREIKKADAVILPGVGAFEEAMKNLRKSKLIKVVQEVIKNEVPFLGICVGFQLLFEKSCEHGVHRGLGIVRGEIKKFKLKKGYKIPHMGWNQVLKGTKSPLFKGIKNNEYFYFVHSYYADCTDKKMNKMYTTYNKKFCSGVWYKNLYAVQFHPEKSQKQGLKLLKNFINRI